MKHSKRLTRKQRILLTKLGYEKELDNLQFIKECGDDMHLYSVSDGKELVISKSKKKGE